MDQSAIPVIDILTATAYLVDLEPLDVLTFVVRARPQDDRRVFTILPAISGELVRSKLLSHLFRVEIHISRAFRMHLPRLVVCP